jgi:hypothetical protein
VKAKNCFPVPPVALSAPKYSTQQLILSIFHLGYCFKFERPNAAAIKIGEQTLVLRG